MKGWIAAASLAVGVGILITASVVAVGGEARANELEQAVSSDGPYNVQLFSGDRWRSYRILAPIVDEDPKLPIFISLHGWGVGPEASELLGGWNDFALANHFILVSPEGVGLSWNAGPCCDPAWSMAIDDVQFISDVIDDVAAHYRVDRARVYAAGMSNGAYMAYHLACERPDLIAAVGSVAGTLFLREGMAEVECAPGRPVPVIEIHGDADVLVPYGGASISGGEVGLDGLGAPGTVEFWAVNNSCSLKTDKKTTFASPHVTCEQFRACEAGSAVELCTVKDGGHNWPGANNLCEWTQDPFTCWWWGYQTDEIAAHEVIWEFVKNYHLPAAAER